jgi:hypothetical protein
LANCFLLFFDVFSQGLRDNLCDLIVY